MLESQKSMEFDPGAAIEAHRSLMATLNQKFWEVRAAPPEASSPYPASPAASTAPVSRTPGL